MTLILKNNILNFNADTLNEVRKEFKLDASGAMEQSVNNLYDWVQKQNHLAKKDFGRGYLERFIISAKGSEEKAKARLDKLCTMRTMAPNLFEKCNVINDLTNIRDFFLQVMMPELTEDNYRILCSKMLPTTMSSALYLQAYQHCVIMCEYMKLHDYAQGYYLVIDLTGVKITDLVTSLNLADFHNILTLIVEGYGIRIKGIHILTSSKVIDILVKIVKQFVSTKIGQRINVLKSVESLHEILPKHLLPEDFGGEQTSILELFDEMNKELSSENHVSHVMKMRQAGINEKRDIKFYEKYFGMSGSFKTLTVD